MSNIAQFFAYGYVEEPNDIYETMISVKVDPNYDEIGYQAKIHELDEDFK
jgi:hypothetical protein